MKIAVFCSNQCPGQHILAAYDWARSIREQEEITIIGGFHTPIEKDILEILLQGQCKIVVVPARSSINMRIPKPWKSAIAENRLRVESPFAENQKRITRANALKRNQYVANLADEIMVIYATPGGQLEQQVKAWQEMGKKISIFLSKSD